MEENQHFLQVARDECSNPAIASKLEWWLTNGIGSYAGGTLSGALTRRYHGLLIAPVNPPLGRMLVFAKADAVLLVGDEEYPLHSNYWQQGVLEPNGCQYIERFYLDGDIPVWHYRLGPVLLEQRIWMTHGMNQTCVSYRRLDGSADTSESCCLKIGLIASFRDHHHVNRVGGFEAQARSEGNTVNIVYAQNQGLYIHHTDGQFIGDKAWIENFYLASEEERGLESVDHHLRVGYLELPLSDQMQGIVISDAPGKQESLQTLLNTAHRRHRGLLEIAFPGLDKRNKPDWIFQLVLAADAFIFKRQDKGASERYSIMAGYPWFGDWGRDTMIALTGLCLATSHHPIALNILRTFAEYIQDGLLPNFFPGDGAVAEYNTVDASLWYVEAWRAYFDATQDLDALQEALPVLQQVITAYRDGTRFGIAMDHSDGLIRAGVEGQQLTWMDARVNGQEITPRIGKPVEINALWYNALRSMMFFCEQLNQPSKSYSELADKVVQGFTRFVRKDGLGLFDVLDGPGGHDDSVRPNQLFSLSLFHSPISNQEDQRAVLRCCEQDLLTPLGLRSLAPSNENYKGVYQGGVAERDSSYHQGPVWGWLLGHFALAHYRVNRDAARAQQYLDGIHSHLNRAGLGQISEIFDGDEPHHPRGTPTQAWSVASILEAWWKLELAKP